MQNSTETDLDWLAFRYISGEIAVSEAEQFEALLADDQAARDAVVRAVELTQAIVAIQTASIRPSAAMPQSWTQNVTWISTSVAALVLVTLALNFNGPTKSATSDSDNIAKAWLDRSAEPVTDSMTLNATLSDEDEFATAEPPNWMLEAVRSLHGDDAPESDETSDEEMES
jgi:hypothetical protein